MATLTADQLALINTAITKVLGSNQNTNFNNVKNYIITKFTAGTITTKDINLRMSSIVREAISYSMAVDPASTVGVKVIDGTTYQGDGNGRYVELSSTGGTTGGTGSTTGVNSVNDKTGDVTLGLNDFGLGALGRADKVLANMGSTFLYYDADHNVNEIRYGTDAQTHYELLSYDANGNLTTIRHYLDGVQKGTTTLTPTGDDLYSVVYVGV